METLAIVHCKTIWSYMLIEHLQYQQFAVTYDLKQQTSAVYVRDYKVQACITMHDLACVVWLTIDGASQRCKNRSFSKGQDSWEQATLSF